MTKLRALDKIDRMVSGPLNVLERLAGGSLYHCCFCRVQFYDRRKLAPRINVQPIPTAADMRDPEVSTPPVTEPPDTASSDE